MVVLIQFLGDGLERYLRSNTRRITQGDGQVQRSGFTVHNLQFDTASCAIWRKDGNLRTGGTWGHGHGKAGHSRGSDGHAHGKAGHTGGIDGHASVRTLRASFSRSVDGA